MGTLTFCLNVTLDGCIDHQEGIADDETHAFFTRIMDEGGAMLWGRVTYEMMESYWPAVARGEEEVSPELRDWAVKLEAKAKYVVSSTRTEFPWANTHHITGDLRAGVQALKDATPAGVLLGSGTLANELDRRDLIDEYRFLVHPRIVGHGPTLHQHGLPATRRLELISAAPLRNGAVDMHYRRALNHPGLLVRLLAPALLGACGGAQVDSTTSTPASVCQPGWQEITGGIVNVADDGYGTCLADESLDVGCSRLFSSATCPTWADTAQWNDGERYWCHRAAGETWRAVVRNVPSTDPTPVTSLFFDENDSLVGLYQSDPPSVFRDPYCCDSAPAKEVWWGLGPESPCVSTEAY